MRLLISIILLLISTNIKAQESCTFPNICFKENESVLYHVYYNVSFIWVNAGEVNFTTAKEKIGNKDVFHIIGDGKTYPSYDWIFKVRDRYESFIDANELIPIKFIRNVNEGSYQIYNHVLFNNAENKATSTNGTFKVPKCVQDVLSSIYYARNIDFSNKKKGDKVFFNMFLDDKVYPIYLTYLGKEKIKTKYGTFNSIKFSPTLIAGTIFKEGDAMTVWVSDDANHVPVRINSPISVGSIKVDLMKFTNLKYPFTSLISKN